MKIEIIIYSEILNPPFFLELLEEYDVLYISSNSLNKKNIKNKNILLLIKNPPQISLDENFFVRNNVLILSLDQNNFIKNETIKYAEFVSGPINTYKFLILIKDFFKKKVNIFGEIKIHEDKVINLINEQSCFLTDLEKKILLTFIEKKEISRNYFLEKILNLNKSVETKTIESHLTRIRKKFKKIGTKINISLKADIFFLEN